MTTDGRLGEYSASDSDDIIERVGAYVALARRQDEPLSVVVMHGEIGVYERLLKSARGSDPVMKLSEDKLLVVCPATDEESALRTAARLAAEAQGNALAGVATLLETDGAEQLIAHACQALAVLESQWDPTEYVISFERLPPEVLKDIEARRRLEPARDAAVAMASAMLSVSDSYTADHSDDVVVLASTVARRMGLSPSQVQSVEIASQLHDVGKVGIDIEILHKPSALDDEEWEVIRRHTVVGERIVRSVPALVELAPVIRHEHERWDGGGYPDGIAGAEIPLGSRIVLACDAYHAMRSDRPYRRAMSHETAVAELRGNAGSQFDPDVVDALIEVVETARSDMPQQVSDTRAWRLAAIALAA